MRISPEELEVLQSQHILMYTAKIGCFMWILCILSLLSYGKSLSSKTGTDRKLRSFELCLSSSITACFNNSSSVFTLLVSLKPIVDEELTDKWSTEDFCLLFFCSWALSFIKSLLSLSGIMLHNWYLLTSTWYLFTSGTVSWLPSCCFPCPVSQFLPFTSIFLFVGQSYWKQVLIGAICLFSLPMA